MGLTSEQVLSMTMWQYNAWCEAYKEKQKAELCLQVQAAYLGAYWTIPSKSSKKSLESIIKDITRNPRVQKAEKIDEKAIGQLKQFEELKKYGYCKW